MKTALRRVGEVWRRLRCRARWLLVLGALVVLLLGAVAVHRVRKVRSERANTARLLYPLDRNRNLDLISYPISPAFCASADGKWLCMIAGVGPDHAWTYLFFDLERRQFAARMGITLEDGEGYFRVVRDLDPGWQSDCFHVREVRYPKPGWFRRQISRWFDIGPYPEVEHSHYTMNLESGRTRLLFVEGFAKGETLPPHADYPNRSHTALACMIRRGGQTAGPRTELIVHDLRRAGRNRKRVLAEASFKSAPNSRVGILGWSDNDRSLVVSEARYVDSKRWGRQLNRIENVYLVDAFQKEEPRKIPVGPLFDRQIDDGAFGPDAVEITWHPGLLDLVNGGRQVRIGVALHSRKTRDDWLLNRPGLWDLDLATGKLRHVTDLTWCLDDLNQGGDVVYSPRGSSVVAPSTTPTVTAGHRLPSWPVTIWTEGQGRRELPFCVQFFLHHGESHSSLGMHLTFVDDDTLVYRSPDNSLWRFGLRTWKSELLWRPGAAEPQMKNEKPTTDNSPPATDHWQLTSASRQPATDKSELLCRPERKKKET